VTELLLTEYPLDRFVVGVILTVAGLFIVCFHRSIKKWLDYWSSRDFPVGYGKMWTGKYTKGGLIFTYGVIIIFGTILLFGGVLQIMRAFRG
jgi:uncharacterized membrane protein HdeD (DUF308 family)